MSILYTLIIPLFLPFYHLAPSDTTGTTRQLAATIHYGLSAPDQVVPATGNAPLGAELTYSWSSRSRRAWEQCHCFANVGVYADYITFRNPTALGQTAGAGLFFEPLLMPRRRTYYALRFSAGLAYLSRVYDPVSNPSNRYVSLPVSTQIGAGLTVHHRLTSLLHLTLTGQFMHISNGGTRQPNQGLNIPSLAVGLAYQPRPLLYPSTRLWKTPAPAHRWLARALLLGSVRVLPQTDQYPEMTLPMVGLNGVGGYRLGASHVLSGGVELTADYFFREQINRWHYTDRRFVQGSLLGGYEFWHGRFGLTAHLAWNLIRPQPYKPATYQKYGLLCRFDNGFTLGCHIKAYGDSTKGFQLAGGMSF